MNHFDHGGHEGMDHSMPGMDHDHGGMDMSGQCAMSMIWCVLAVLGFTCALSQSLPIGIHRSLIHVSSSLNGSMCFLSEARHAGTLKIVAS